MKAVIYPAKGEVALRDLPAPEPARDAALIRVRSSGICHTDIDVLHARYGSGAFPLVPGHEFSGEIVALGPDVSGLVIGDRVVVDPNLSCGSCRPCLRGQHNLCVALGAYGVSVAGGLAELTAVSSANLHLIGALPFDQAALAEPMACVLNGVSALAPRASDVALIFGAGPIGLLLAIALRTRGVSQITLADINPARLDLAVAFGFNAVASGSAELAALRRGLDICIDATGRAEVAAGLTEYAADGGSVLFFGVCPPDARIAISPFEVFRRQLRLMGTHSLNRNIPEALDAIRSYGPDIARIVSHRVGLEEVAQIIASGAPAGSLKIQAELP